MEQENYTTNKNGWKQLTEKDRYKIEGMRESGQGTIQIAKVIGCSRRTVEREIKMGLVEQMVPCRTVNRANGDMEVRMVYRADTAQARHDQNASNKGRNLKIGKNHEFAAYVEEKIGSEHWSPDAVLGDAKKQGLPFAGIVCTKTLYNYIDSGLFLNISNKDLLFKKEKKKREYRQVRSVPLNNRNGRGIEDRPDGVDAREEKGHWEIDLVIGKKNTRPAVLTLVERKSRKSVYVLIRDKTQAEVLKAVGKAVEKIPGDFGDVFKTITADNGPEFLDGAGIKAASGCGEVYYTHPYCSWEKGSNENGNRMLRRFLPKGTDFSTVSEDELQRIEDWVNSYPRRIFGYKSANEMFEAA